MRKRSQGALADRHSLHAWTLSSNPRTASKSSPGDRTGECWSRPPRSGLNRNSLWAVSTLRASPLRGSFQIAAQFVTRAIHGARPSGAFASLRRPNRQSCRFVEPEGSSTPPSPPVTKKAPSGAFFVTGGEGGIRTLERGLAVTHFPGVLLQPLGHLTGTWMSCHRGQNEARTL